MGVSTSAMTTSKEWMPASSADVPRKMSKAGYDITPLTQEQVDAEAAKASPNTRCTSLVMPRSLHILHVPEHVPEQAPQLSHGL
jgi:hypothetical protein